VFSLYNTHGQVAIRRLDGGPMQNTILHLSAPVVQRHLVSPIINAPSPFDVSRMHGG